MGGIYGDVLAFNPSLFSDYDIFTMDAKLVAGYANKKVVLPKTEGYLSRSKGGMEAIVSELRTENQKAQFWMYDTIPRGLVNQGLYVEDDGELYQFTTDNGYSREGGYHVYDLQLVVGNTGEQKRHRNVFLGQEEY
jgi:hypothetical protein